MANNQLFSRPAPVAATDTINAAGGRAYALSPEHALAQYAATGCLNATFYANDEEQLDAILSLAGRVSTTFLAKTAVYARTRGFMKDTPALLCAALAILDGELLERIFDRVIDTPKMLRTFVQIVRSGRVGRRSLGSRPKRLVRRWLDARTDEEIFFASVGNSPSMADIIRMVHPCPRTPSRRALYAYLIGRPHEPAELPAIVISYERFKTERTPAEPGSSR